MIYTILVASGKGSRMGEEIPKQFLLLDDKPILYYSMQLFLNYHPEVQIVLVVPQDCKYAEEFIEKYVHGNTRLSIVYGGETRFHSVQNGLYSLSANEEDLVMIHDGVRPFVSNNVLHQCIALAIEKGNAIPAMDVKDSLRKMVHSENEQVSRQDFKAIQTPQVFSLKAIRTAYQQEYTNAFTDDASVFESAGHKIYLTEGNEENIKITTPIDLEFARYLLRR